jgi:sorting nexin-8
MMASTNIKRHRDPLSPKPILDRATLSKYLHININIPLKNADRQIDLFYQLLHRSGYNIPLDVFVASLLHDDGVVAETNRYENVGSKLPTKNAVSSRPGRLPQLSKSFLQFLSDTCINSEDGFVMLTSKVKMHQTSADGTTTKIAVELQDGHVVESVLMRHEGRATLCVSSQVG